MPRGGPKERKERFFYWFNRRRNQHACFWSCTWISHNAIGNGPLWCSGLHVFADLHISDVRVFVISGSELSMAFPDSRVFFCRSSHHARPTGKHQTDTQPKPKSKKNVAGNQANDTRHRSHAPDQLANTQPGAKCENWNSNLVLSEEQIGNRMKNFSRSLKTHSEMNKKFCFHVVSNIIWRAT